MLDTTEINRTDLVELVGSLKKSGRYFIGPCPFCGGRDRFNVKRTADGDLWICRQCGDGKYHDVVSFLMQRDGLTFRELVAREQPANGRKAAPAPARAAAPALSGPPDADWQKAAKTAVQTCHETLIARKTKAGASAYDYLVNQRGLTDETISSAMLGYNPAWLEVAPGCWLAPGITIPAFAGGHLWYVQTRVTKAARREAEKRGRPLDKYHSLTGSRLKSLYRADTLLGAKTAVVTEGEFDALLLAQFLPAGWTAVTMGSAGALPDNPAWLRYFAAIERVFLVLDNDDAGRQGLARWQGLLRWVELLPVPGDANDVTDYWSAGGDVATWLASTTGLGATIRNTEPRTAAWQKAAAEYTEQNTAPFTRFSRLPVVFPANTSLPFPAGSWRRLEDGRISADLCFDDLETMKEWKELVVC